MRFVHNDRVVGKQVPVLYRFGKQDAVGHDLDQRFGGRLFFKADFVGYGFPAGLPEFGSDARGNADSGNPTGLCQPDHPASAKSRRQTHLGNLRCFARSRFTGNDDNRMIPDGFDDEFLSGCDGQFGREVKEGNASFPVLHPAARIIKFILHSCQGIIRRKTVP